ncbi:unnamed protein product [Microthlaspi erraticum]|uniref:Uncharacterized protein n=1 Tax=Microthlaspi erraticum TaxID=1685480 RepID=A0A6D2L081_9BRAS|nr:unnamed protein product [Microthlaspi erraticum]
MLYFLCTQPTYTFALACLKLITCSVQSGPRVRYPFTTSDLCTCRIRDRKGEDLIPRSKTGQLRPASDRKFIGQVFIRPTTAADHASVRPRPFRSYGAAMTRSSGRSSRPTVPTPRSTRSPF